METTEIYICKEGQSIKNGRMVMSHDIENKADAETDAKERCQYDKKAYKLIYYRVTLEGDFKLIFTYTNPYYSKKTTPKIEEPAKVKKKKPKAPPPKKSWVQKILGK